MDTMLLEGVEAISYKGLYIVMLQDLDEIRLYKARYNRYFWCCLYAGLYCRLYKVRQDQTVKGWGYVYGQRQSQRYG